MKKQFFYLSLALGFVFGSLMFTSCGSDDDDTTTNTPPPSASNNPESTDDDGTHPSDSGTEGETPSITPEFVSTALTLEAIDAGTITFDNKAAGIVSYRIDGGDVQTIAVSTSGNISVTAGQKVTFYGDNATYGATSSSNCSKISCSADVYVYGNVMSLVSSTGYESVTTLPSGNENTFRGLFAGNSHIKNHSEKDLVLPATTLTRYCYYGMFSGCTGLTKAPVLPAAEVKEYCYSCMFLNCSGLTSAPVLSAMVLARECYTSMFEGCANLTTAPALPATTMYQECYKDMFSGCTNLATAPELPATTLADGCYIRMFQNCSSLVTAPNLPAATLKPTCYKEMFKGCSSLNSIKCLATNRDATDCTTNWVSGVSGSGSFYKASTITWTEGTSGKPAGWTEYNAN